MGGLITLAQLHISRWTQRTLGRASSSRVVPVSSLRCDVRINPHAPIPPWLTFRTTWPAPTYGLMGQEDEPYEYYWTSAMHGDPTGIVDRPFNQGRDQLPGRLSDPRTSTGVPCSHKTSLPLPTPGAHFSGTEAKPKPAPTNVQMSGSSAIVGNHTNEYT